MKNLTKIDLTAIKPKSNYLMIISTYERHGDGEQVVKSGTGKEVIGVLKETFLYDGFIEDNPTANEFDFLLHAGDLNGDGWDYVEIYEL